MVYAHGFASRPPSIWSYDRERSSSDQDWGAVDWGTTPERLEDREHAFSSKSERSGGLWGRISRFMTGALATAALTFGLYEGRAAAQSYSPPLQQTVHEHVLSDDEAQVYRAGADAPNSLWRIAEEYLSDSLPEEQPARDQRLIEATDRLAQENGLCPPSVWHAQHPLGTYQDAFDCDDGTASPHILGFGQEVSVGSLTQPSEDAGASLEERFDIPTPPAHEPDVDSPLNYLEFGPDDSIPPIKGLPDAPDRIFVASGDELEVVDPSASLEERAADGERRGMSAGDWIFGGLAAAGLGAAAWYFSRRDSGEPSPHELDWMLTDPQRGLEQTPHGNATLAFGHAYLAKKDYLDRTSDAPTQGSRYAGAARTAMERKAARLNRLAAMLDTSYVPVSDTRSLADHVRESLDIENLTDRTAHRYVQELADLGHTNAQAYLEQMPQPHPAKRSMRSKRRARTPKARQTKRHGASSRKSAQASA